MWIDQFKKVARPLLDIVYPRTCQHCGRPAEATAFYCWDCLADFTYVQAPFCSICGDPVPGHIDHEYICGFCSRSTPHFDLARSAVRYTGPIGTAIRSVKYHAATWLIPDFVDLLEACYEAHYNLFPFDAVCYVPMVPVKQRDRGFNQSALLASLLAKRLGYPLLRRALRRTRDTKSQTYLTASQRVLNVKGVFEIRARSPVEGKKLLLVDDVMTTGATANECARMLKVAGATSIHVLTVARG